MCMVANMAGYISSAMLDQQEVAGEEALLHHRWEEAYLLGGTGGIMDS